MHQLPVVMNVAWQASGHHRGRRFQVDDLCWASAAVPPLTGPRRRLGQARCPGCP